MYKKVADTQRASTGCLIVSSPEGKSTGTVTTVAPIFPSTCANSLKQDFPACSYNFCKPRWLQRQWFTILVALGEHPHQT